jgi:sulfotransferase
MKTPSCLAATLARSTVYQRLEGLAQHDQLVGFSWAALREAFYGEHAKHLLSG